jgi:hypothetical protein
MRKKQKLFIKQQIVWKDDKYDISIHSKNNLENFDKEKHEQLDLFTGECEGMCGV